MIQNSLGLTIRCFFVVFSLFVMFSQAARADQYAILVGVWDYENPNLQLDAPPNDLKLMEAVLSAQGVTQEQMHILPNPNKAQIQRKFRELSRRLTPADSLLFYFSGHGTQIIDKLGTFPGDEARGRYPDRNDEALLPVDADLASPKTYLLDDELNTSTPRTTDAAGCLYYRHVLLRRHTSRDSPGTAQRLAGSGYPNGNRSTYADREPYGGHLR